MARCKASSETVSKANFAEAAMRRAIHKLVFETHPIVGRPVCAIEHEGDVIFFDEDEIKTAAALALSEVIANEITRFKHLPDIRLDQVCRQRLTITAVQNISRTWTQ